jgi:hypothetical protein
MDKGLTAPPRNWRHWDEYQAKTCLSRGFLSISYHAGVDYWVIEIIGRRTEGRGRRIRLTEAYRQKTFVSISSLNTGLQLTMSLSPSFLGRLLVVLASYTSALVHRPKAETHSSSQLYERPLWDSKDVEGERVQGTYLFRQSKKASVLTHPCIFWRSNSILTICKVWIAIFTCVGPKWPIGEADENIILEVDERSESNKRIELGDDWTELSSGASSVEARARNR